MAISPELPDGTLTMAVEARDPHRHPQRRDERGHEEVPALVRGPGEVKTLYLEKFGLNLEKHNGAGRWELPVPATYVLDRDGIVRAGEADPDYTVRMEPAEVVAAIRNIVGGALTRCVFRLGEIFAVGIVRNTVVPRRTNRSRYATGTG